METWARSFHSKGKITSYPTSDRRSVCVHQTRGTSRNSSRDFDDNVSGGDSIELETAVTDNPMPNQRAVVAGEMIIPFLPTPQRQCTDILFETVDTGDVATFSTLLGLCERSAWKVLPPSATEPTILHYVAKHGSFPFARIILKKLLAKSPSLPNSDSMIDDVDENGRTPLMLAAIAGRSDVVDELLEYGADWTIIDDEGCNVVFLALLHCRETVVNVLLHHQIQVSTEVKNEVTLNTVLMELVSRGDEHTLHLFLSTFHDIVDIDYTDDDYLGMTALHVACLMADNDVNIVSLLLQHGASIDVTDYDGRTPLMYAVISNRKLIVGYLLSHHASVHQKDIHNRCALDIATASTKRLFEGLLVPAHMK